MKSRVVTYATWIVRLRWLVLLITLAAFAAIASGGQYIKFSNDYRYFFTHENPNLIAFEKLERTYTSPDTILWVLQPQDGVVTTPHVLGVIEEITQAAWQTPFSIRVDSITNFQHTRAADDDLLVRALAPEPDQLDAQGAQYVRDVATSEPAIAKRLISDDARTAAIMATLKLPRDDINANSQSVAFARQIVNDIRERYPDIRIELTGSAMLSNTFAESAQRDLATLTPLMYAVLALTVYLLLRSIYAVIATMIVVGISAIAAMGFVMGWLGVPLTPPSSGAPTVILTVAVADAIHILMTMLSEMRKGKDKHAAIIESMRINWQPVFLTSVTTAIGFLSLNFSDAPPFRDLGNTSAAGAVFAWILSVTFLPAFIAIAPIKVRATSQRQGVFVKWLAEFVIRFRTLILFAMICLVSGFAMLLPRFEFNDRFVEYFDERVEFRRATDWAADNLTGIYQISYSVESGETGGIANPQYLERLEAFTQWYRAQPEVVHVASFTDVMKRVNKSMHGDDEASYIVPSDRETAAQFLLLYEMSLPYGLDLNDQINVDKSATKLTITLTDISTTQMADQPVSPSCSPSSAATISTPWSREPRSH